MDVKDYQALSARTINKDITRAEMIDHAINGLWSEYGEIRGCFQKVYQGHKLDRDVLSSEIGDALWFAFEICTAIDHHVFEPKNLYFGQTERKALKDLAEAIISLEYKQHILNEEYHLAENVINELVTLCLSLDFDYTTVMENNINKLKKRYPDGFDPEKSLHRAEGDI